ncbi:MAG: tRNA guanosine(34) transglycosylase Tgt [Planctomycetota bacterium]
MAGNFEFTLLRGDRPDGPRRGRCDTPHGSFETPCFAPIGTKAAVKGLFPEHVRATGAELILANTYHLALRPGADLIAEAGGLHRFMDWDGPILTDSGGYQVFSLAGKRRVDDRGVTFWGADAGQELRLTPESALSIQRALGADVVMVLDECPPHDATPKALREACRRTLVWAREARDLHRDWGGRDRGQALFGIVQGGADAGLRRESAEELCRLGFDGYAIGGVSVGESKERMRATVEGVTPLLPVDQCRYLMGVGDPDDLCAQVLRGIDLFDCVSPTRNGRCNRVWIPEGVLNMRNAHHRAAFVPLQEGCPCPACTRWTRAYVRHLALTGEMLGAILQSLHNLWFVEGLMAGLRERIAAGDDAAAVRAWFRDRYPGWAGDGPVPIV